MQRLQPFSLEAPLVLLDGIRIRSVNNLTDCYGLQRFTPDYFFWQNSKRES